MVLGSSINPQHHSLCFSPWPYTRARHQDCAHKFP